MRAITFYLAFVKSIVCSLPIVRLLRVKGFYINMVKAVVEVTFKSV